MIFTGTGECSEIEIKTACFNEKVRVELAEYECKAQVKIEYEAWKYDQKVIYVTEKVNKDLLKVQKLLVEYTDEEKHKPDDIMKELQKCVDMMNLYGITHPDFSSYYGYDWAKLNCEKEWDF